MPPSETKTNFNRSRSATPLAGVPALAGLKKYFHVYEFTLGGRYAMGNPDAYEFGGQGGTTLESLGQEPLRTSYIAVGTPERDSEGTITNAVIISSYYSGDSTWCYYYWYEGQAGNEISKGGVVGPGKLIDTDKYYVVFLDALGLWGTSKPSDGLGLRFPQYSLLDTVQANYRLLRDHLNVTQVKLATGVSMGATQSYLWALLHPGFVEAILPIGGVTCTEKNTVLKWTFQLAGAAMMSDPVWRETKGDYYHLPKEQHPNQGMMFAQSIMALHLLGLEYRIRQGWEQVEQEVFFWEPHGKQGRILAEMARMFDVNDLLIRNRSQEALDIEENLSSITCPALILHARDDLWLMARLAEEAAGRVPGAQFISFESALAHYGIFQAPNILRSEVGAFFDKIGL